MTFLTKHYTLPAFQEGQAISASLDQRRMRIIDQELGFLANLVGDGRISGWQIVDQSTTSEYSFRLKPGIGIIDKFSIETIGPMDFTLPESSSKFYVYLQRKKGVVGGISGFSNMVNIETPYDNTPPSNVSYFTIDGVTESNISLSWNKNLENDISSYILERSLDGSNWSIIEKLDHPTNSYVDESLSENTDYYYRIKAVDINNNESFYTISSPPSITTDKDLSKPALPSSFLSFPQDGQIQLTWTVPEFGNIDYYSIEYFEVDSEYNMIGSPSTSTTIDTKIIIDSLNNSSIYKFILTSVSVNGVSSEEVSLFETPVELNGPSEVVNLSVIDQSDSNNVNQIALSISWDEATGEYAIPADKYEIIIIENGSITSSPIEVSSSNNVSINVLVNNLDSTTEIKPRTDYIILVKSIDSNGNKSNGVIENITTRNFKSPNSPTSLVSIEDNDGRKLIMSHLLFFRLMILKNQRLTQ